MVRGEPRMRISSGVRISQPCHWGRRQNTSAETGSRPQRRTCSFSSHHLLAASLIDGSREVSPMPFDATSLAPSSLPEPLCLADSPSEPFLGTSRHADGSIVPGPQVYCYCFRLLFSFLLIYLPIVYCSQLEAYPIFFPSLSCLPLLLPSPRALLGACLGPRSLVAASAITSAVQAAWPVTGALISTSTWGHLDELAPIRLSGSAMVDSKGVQQVHSNDPV